MKTLYIWIAILMLISCDKEDVDSASENEQSSFIPPAFCLLGSLLILGG